MSANDLFVDTSGWASYLVRTDPHHDGAKRALDAVMSSARHAVTSNYVLAELVALLTARGRMPRSRLLLAMDAITSDSSVRIIHVDPVIDRAAWSLLRERPDKEWSLVDATSFHIMRGDDMIEALTTDRHFAQAGFRCML